MHCPFCHAQETKVVDSRLVADGYQVRRRRVCANCHERFTTFEVAELVVPRVIKSDGVIEPFDQQKLRSGLERALEKRPVSIEQTEQLISRIESSLRATGEREVASHYIGNLVMEGLKKLDQVAYVRFASVYLSFEDINAFQQAIEGLTPNRIAVDTGVDTDDE